MTYNLENDTLYGILVPDGNYYLLGDNRTMAYDSRSIGTVKAEDIKGRIIYNYWSSPPDRINKDLKNNKLLIPQKLELTLRQSPIEV